MEGLRERKKRETKEAIASAAMELFVAHGYDDVTVADVARAADVSEKTVFNHFPTKEDLVFHRSDDRLAERVELLRNRPPGVPISRVFEAGTMAVLDMIEAGETDGFLTVPRLVRASPVLRGRLMLSWEHEAYKLAAAISDDNDDLVAAAAIRALVWAHRLVLRTAIRRLLQGDDPAAVANELRTEAQRVYARLDEGLARYSA